VGLHNGHGIPANGAHPILNGLVGFSTLAKYIVQDAFKPSYRLSGISCAIVGRCSGAMAPPPSHPIGR